MIIVNGKEYRSNFFPDGTHLMKFDNFSEKYNIVWKFENNEEMVTLYYLIRHIQDNKQNKEEISLTIPYLPNARMDRVKSKEEVFTLKYFCEFINSLNLDLVVVNDVHSEVSMDMIKRAVNIHPISAIEKAVYLSKLNPDKDVIFYPDKGSYNRYNCASKDSYLENFSCIYGEKNRDWATGKILGLNIIGDIPSSSFDVLIIDDICSYGGTIYYSALKLKEIGAKDIYVYTTHCENSVLHGKFGEDKVPLMDTGLIKKFYTTDSIFTEKHNDIEII